MQSLHSQMVRGVLSGHCSKKRKHQPRFQQSMHSVIRLVCRFITGPCRGAFPPSFCTKDAFTSTARDSNTGQAGTPLLDRQPVCRRTGSCSEEDAPRVGLEIVRALAGRLSVVRRFRVSPPLSVGFCWRNVFHDALARRNTFSESLLQISWRLSNLRGWSR